MATRLISAHACRGYRIKLIGVFLRDKVWDVGSKWCAKLSKWKTHVSLLVRWENIKLLWKSRFLYCCWNFCAPSKYRFWGHLNLYLLLFSPDCTQVSVKSAKSLGVIFLCSANTSYGITLTTSSCRASLRCLQVATITWKYQNGLTGLTSYPTWRFLTMYFPLSPQMVVKTRLTRLFQFFQQKSKPLGQNQC